MLSAASEHVKAGISEQMSLLEKAQLQAFSAGMSATGKQTVQIQKHKTTPPVIKVENVNTSPSTTHKSSWLNTAFTSPGESNDNEELPFENYREAATEHTSLAYKVTL
jgi:hypothetical protein